MLLQRIGHETFGARGDRKDGPGLADPNRLIDGSDVLQELNCLRWGILADGEPVATTETVGRSTGATFDRREREPPELGGEPLLDRVLRGPYAGLVRHRHPVPTAP